MAYFYDLAVVCEKVAAVSSKKEKVKLVSEFLKGLNPEEVGPAILLITGRIFPYGSNRSLGVGWSMVFEALTEAYELSEDLLHKLLEESADIGDLFELAVKEAKPRFTPLYKVKLTIMDVYKTYVKLSSASGRGSRDRKLALLKFLIANSSPLEAKLIARDMVGEVRIGFYEGLMEEAVSSAFEIPLDIVREKVLITGDVYYVAVTAASSGLEGVKKLKIEVFRPVKPMLAANISDLKQVIDKLRDAILDYKLDGVRVQIHKKGDLIKVYTRRLRDITNRIPEIVEKIKNTIKVEKAILDGEVIAVGSDGRPLPFQFVMRRIGKKKVKGDQEVRLRLYIFDILLSNDEILINKPLIYRRERLRRLCENLMVPTIRTSNYESTSNFLKEALAAGHEGIMVKKIESRYTPGVRGMNWLKYKPTMPTLDLVIVAADWGYGRRHNWLSNYHLAAWDPRVGRFRVLGKTFKGLTDEEFEEMTKKLLELKVAQHGHTVWVKPEIVVEVAFNEIQKSNKYESGYALRFARITALRYDKSPYDSSTMEEVEKLYNEQFRRKSKG